ncbi:MAG TPA: (Fe-S)-binding protein, partial [Syntrophomonadaceae bacterium]|nr:(Fe-S)-binding protein [Syntrophomonadaceae bacterium]
MKFHELPPVKEQIMKCVRCGKCRSVCPVFAEVKNETVAPRGHVFMVQMLRDGVVEPSKAVNERLTTCLLCEACNVVCPSGIDIHELNAAARSYIYENNPTVSKELVFDTLWTKPSLLRFSTKFVWGAQKAGLQKLARNLGITKILPGDLGKAEKILDSLPSRSASSIIKEVNPPQGEKKYTVGYFLGCGTDLLQPQVALATIDVLTRNGVEVIVPRTTKCCGLPHIANGKIETAQKLAVHNIKMFNSYDFDYIITDCASCSAALAPSNMQFLLGGRKIEDEALLFASKVIDLTKFLIDILDIKLPEKNTIEKIK